MSDRIIYFHGKPIDDDNSKLLAAEVSLSLPVTLEVVANLQHHGSIDVKDYPEDLRGKVGSLLKAVDLREGLPTEADATPDNAAVAIVSTLTHSFGEQFSVTDDMLIAINPNNVPSLADSYLVLSKILGFKDVTLRADDYSSWLLGAFVVACEAFFGENEFNASQVCEETGKAYNTIYQAKETHLQFAHCKRDLTFSHHREMACMKLSEKEKGIALDLAERLQVSCRDTRAIGNFLVRNKEEGIKKLKKVSSTEKLDQTLKEGQEDKADYYVQNEDESWQKIRSTQTDPPKGKIVINLKTDEWTNQNGAIQPIAVNL